MSRLARLVLPLAVFFGYPMHHAEARMNKCTDGKQITYTTEPCEKSGLTSAGPIKDAVTVMPILPKSQKDSSEKSGKGLGEGNDAPKNTAPGDASDADIPRETTIKPTSPLVNKMLNM